MQFGVDAWVMLKINIVLMEVLALDGIVVGEPSLTILSVVSMQVKHAVNVVAQPVLVIPTESEEEGSLVDATRGYLEVTTVPPTRNVQLNDILTNQCFHDEDMLLSRDVGT